MPLIITLAAVAYLLGLLLAYALCRAAAKPAPKPKERKP